MEPKVKGRKWPLIVGIAIVGLIAIFLFGLSIANIITGNILDRTIARLKSEGFRVSPEGLMPVCSDDENAAIPWEKAREIFSLKSEAVQKVYERSYVNRSSLTSEDERTLRELFVADEPVLELMREAASRPYFTFQPDYSKPMASWEFPRLVGVSKMCRILILTRGRLALDEGNQEEALECCLLGLKSARLISQVPTFLDSMMSFALFNMTVALCEEAIASAFVPEEIGKELIGVLDPKPLRDGFATALDGERLGVLDTGTRLLAGEEIKVAWGGHPIDFSPFHGRFAPVLNFLARPVVRMDTAMIQDINMREVKAAQRPYWEAKPLFEEIDKEVENLSNIHFYARSLIMPMGKYAAKFAQAEARAQVMRLALACKLHARDKGKFPSGLEVLTPAYFKELPLDPYTGKEFVYRLRPEGGFVLYSVGPDGKDDGGTPLSDDIIWEQKPATKAGLM